MERFWSRSEVGRGLEAVDWAATPIGLPEEWSQSLKTAVRILLSSKFAMWMAWGPELTFFCNDAYRRDTLGTKYPWALGRSATEVWSEIWPDIGPRIDTVMSTGEATWDESLQLYLERSGFVEETYHTFSYSPLSDDDGSVAGMLCVVSEVTDQAISTRRMTTLRDLGARMAGHLTEPEAIVAATEELAADPLSLPFGLVYLQEPDDDQVWLAGSFGIDPGHALAPVTIAVDDASAPWRVVDALAGETVTVDLQPLAPAPPQQPWDEPPLQAVVVPLAGAAATEPYGFLVAGLSRYRPLDEAYAGFVDLVAGQIAASVAAARMFEGEKRRAETLARLDQAKTDFFTNVSHEFRTPLTLLLGPTEDALRDPSVIEDDAQRARFEVVHRNAQRLLQLVNSLLDFSRLEAGGATSHFEPVDLRRVTEPLVAMFESAARQAGLDLVVDLDEIEGRSYVDVEHWAKIVLNLLSNAFKFTFDGSITVRLREVEGNAVLTVEDTGCGIAAEELPHLFERFHRVRGAVARTHEGSGVGLALVSELARLHGGEASATSTLDVGTQMSVSIPLGRAHLPAAEVTEAAELRTESGEAPTALVSEVWRWIQPDTATEDDLRPRSDRPRVLVVDDNADMRHYVVGLLADAYEVTQASDGIEALERLAESSPDLVLTDVTMPRLDGFGLLARLQADPRTTSIPVIMLSARAGEEGTVEGLEAGAADYLVKPFSARELLARVRVNLELDRMRRIRATLERSEALLDQAQRLARVGSWEVDLGSGSVVGSEELLRLLGYSRQAFEELGYPGVLEGVIHPDDLERVRTILDDLEVNDVTAYDMRTVGADGVERQVSVRAALVGDAEGRPVILQGSMQDVTEQRAAEQALAAARAREEAAQREHSIAEELQRSLLPADSFDLAHLDVSTYYRAGVEGMYVGGDWYDIIELSGGRTALVMGDVMGRGVLAASVMGQLRSAVRAFATIDLAPDDVLRHLDALVQDLAGDQIVTCVYAVFDPREEALHYANAGHLPPIVVDAEGSAVRLTRGGPPLGAGYGETAADEVPLTGGATLVLYTDGLVEHRGEDIDVGIAALEHQVASRAATHLDDVPEAVVDALLPGGPDDDVAVLVARVRSEHQVAELSIEGADRPTVAQAREFVVERLAGWDVPEPVVRDVALVASELVTNAIVHGGTAVGLRLEIDHSKVVVQVEDDAADRVPAPRDAEDDEENGRGLRIVEALSDDWGVRPTRRGKGIWSERAWGQDEGAS